MPHPAVAVVQSALDKAATAEQIVDALISAGFIGGARSDHMRAFQDQFQQAGGTVR